jgi:capsular polysaccharide biosynthesis protein
MDDEIDLRDIFSTLWKSRILIIGVSTLFILIAGMISYAMPSEYEVSSIVAMGNFDDPVYASPVSAKSIMLSDEFLLDVFERIRPNATGGEFTAFKDRVKVEPVKDSDKLVKISVETSDRAEGQKAVEMMVWLYANHSAESYNEQKSILSRQLAVAQERLDAMDMQINLTNNAFMNLEESSDSSSVQSEMRFSRTLDRLNDMETQRSDLIERIQGLQKQLVLLRHLDVVLPAREPVSPIGPRRVLNTAVAGMLGLMIGIFAAFLRVGLKRPVE